MSRPDRVDHASWLHVDTRPLWTRAAVTYHARLTANSSKRVWPVRTAWTLGVSVVVVLFVRTFVGDVYHVDSGSMEPTLWGAEGGGEWLFVRYTDARPSRQDLVVAKRAGDDAPIVKRVLGLPGESVQVSGGDVLVNGKRLAADEPRPPWILLVDQNAGPFVERFPVAASQRGVWTLRTGVADLDARRVPTDANLGLLFLQPDALYDDYLGPEGERVRGTRRAGDARIELDVIVRDAGSQLRVGLAEEGDLFQVSVRPAADGRAALAITRRNSESDRAVELARAETTWPLDVARRIAFQNRDNVLRVEIDGATVLSATYHENALIPPGDLRPDYLSRAWFGGDSGRFEFRGVRVLRDFAYTDRGTFGIGAPLDLGPDDYFLLGDHSPESRDSREMGPVRAQDLIGRPVAVVWPPARWRMLRATEKDS